MFGAERGNLEALAALRSQGAEVLLLVPDVRWNAEMLAALDARGFVWRTTSFVQIHSQLTLYQAMVGNPLRLIRAMVDFLRICSHFKPTHIHAFDSKSVFAFALGLTLKRAPMVFRAGDEPTVHNRIWRAIWRFTVWRTRQFVANSQFVARSLERSGAPPDKITLIYNRPPSRSAASLPPIALDLPKDARVIAFVGQIAEHKGPHLLVAAFKELAAAFPDVHVVLAGRISDWEGDSWARDLKAEAEQDPILAARTHFLGMIENIPHLLERAFVVVAPSVFDDPSPNVVMEAKRAGRAVVGFPSGGIPELIEAGVDGLICEEKSVPSLRRALEVYLREPALAARHGLASARSLRTLNVDDFDQRWSQAYRRAASAERGSAT